MNSFTKHKEPKWELLKQSPSIRKPSFEISMTESIYIWFHIGYNKWNEFTIIQILLAHSHFLVFILNSICWKVSFCNLPPFPKNNPFCCCQLVVLIKEQYIFLHWTQWYTILRFSILFWIGFSFSLSLIFLDSSRMGWIWIRIFSILLSFLLLLEFSYYLLFDHVEHPIRIVIY